MYKTLEATYWTYFTDNSGTTSGPFKRGIGANESFCMQTAFHPGTNSEFLRLYCYAFNGKWTVGFEGDAREVKDAFEILDNS